MANKVKLDKLQLDLKADALTLPDKLKIAAFLNVVFAPAEKEVWEVRRNNVVAVFFNDRYLPSDISKSFRSPAVASSISNFFPVSSIADELGFTQVLLDELRKTMKPEPHKRTYCFYFSVETGLQMCLQLVKNLERLTEQGINVNLVPTDSSSGFYDVKNETAQIKQMIDGLCKDRDYQKDLRRNLVEVTPFSRDVAGIVVQYARMFAGSLPVEDKKVESTEAKIFKPG